MNSKSCGKVTGTLEIVDFCMRLFAQKLTRWVEVMYHLHE
jgi:hypothetical protein